MNNLAPSILSIIKAFFFTKWVGALNFKTSSKTCVVIGNGPSFRKSLENHLDLLKNNELLCVNSFSATEYYEVLKPKFYVLQAPVLFYDENQLSDTYITIRNDIFQNIIEKTLWDLYLIVPFKAKKSNAFQAILNTNKNVKPLYFNDTALEGFSFIKTLFFNKRLGMPRPHNVLIPSLMNAIHIGFKEIFIIGADHSWLGEISVNDKNEALVHQKHFYDEENSKPEKMQDYIHRPRRLHEILNKFYLTFRGYWEIKEYAATKGVKIINASESSMIDAFERGSLESIK